MRRFFGLFLGVILACASALAADEYKIDPRHSNVNFSVIHMTVSTVRGRFTDFDGKIVMTTRTFQVLGERDHQGRQHHYRRPAAR